MATEAELRKLLKDRGVSDHVIGEEAPYLAQKYGNDAAKVANESMSSYLGRTNNETGHRPYDSQSTNAAEQEANRLADEAKARGGDGGHPSDVEIRNGGGGGNGPSGPSGMQSWLGNGAGGANPMAAAMQQQNTLLQQLFDRQVAEQNRIAAEQAAKEAELKTRRDSLYGQLQGRAQQSLTLDPNDPIIKGQVDNYRAEQERALRNVRSDAAEGKQALRPTQDRMAGERVAQGVASMQAELMARELGSRRGEIADALSSMGGILSGDQQAGMQRELASLDNIIRQQQLGISNRDLDLQRELGLGQLDLGRGRLGLDTELGRGDLALRGELGRGGLSNDLLRTMLQNEQFYGDLGLRQQTQDDFYNLKNRRLY